MEGTYSFSRTELPIANGVTGGGDITFELHAGKTWGDAGATTTYNRVDEGSWSVTVQYYEEKFTRPCLEDLRVILGSTPSMVVKPSFPDYLYTLQFNVDVKDANGWQNVPEQTKIPGDGQPLQMDLIGIESEPSVFYRVLMETAP